MTNRARSLIKIALQSNLSNQHALSLTPSFSWGYGTTERLEPLQQFPACLNDQARYPETAKAVPNDPCCRNTSLKRGVNERGGGAWISFGI